MTEEQPELNQELVLTIELIPETAWNENLRKYLPTWEWDRIRKGVYQRNGYRCEICNAPGKLNCHEVWSYDDELSIQKLAGFLALCNKCHGVKHFGFMEVLSRQGKVDLDEVVEHFLEVNQVGYKEFRKHLSEQTRIWRQRSEVSWSLDMGKYGMRLWKDEAEKYIKKKRGKEEKS